MLFRKWLILIFILQLQIIQTLGSLEHSNSQDFGGRGLYTNEVCSLSTIQLAQYSQQVIAFQVLPEIYDTTQPASISIIFTYGSTCDGITYSWVAWRVLDSSGISIEQSLYDNQALTTDPLLRMIDGYDDLQAAFTLQANLISSSKYFGKTIQMTIQVQYNGIPITTQPNKIIATISVQEGFKILPPLNDLRLYVNDQKVVTVSNLNTVDSIRVYQFDPLTPAIPFIFYDPNSIGNLIVSPQYSCCHTDQLNFYVVVHFTGDSYSYVTTLKVTIDLVLPYLERPLSDQFSYKKITLNAQTSYALQSLLYISGPLTDITFEVIDSNFNPMDAIFMAWNYQNLSITFYPLSGLGVRPDLYQFSMKIVDNGRQVYYGPTTIEVVNDGKPRFTLPIVDNHTPLQQKTQYTLPSVDNGLGIMEITLTKDDRSPVYPFIKLEMGSVVTYMPQAPREIAGTVYNIIIKVSNGNDYIEYSHKVTVTARVGLYFKTEIMPIEIYLGDSLLINFPEIAGFSNNPQTNELHANGYLDLDCSDLILCQGNWDLNSYTFNIPSNFQVGTYIVYAVLNENSINYYPFNLRVLNHRPEWTLSLQDITTVQGIVRQISTPQWNDIENDPLTVTIDVGGANFITYVINQTAKRVDFTMLPTLATSTGQYIINLFLDDFKGQQVSTSFIVAVAANQPPTFLNNQLPLNQTIAVDGFQIPYYLPATYDPEDQVVVISFIIAGGAYPPFILTNSQLGLVSISPPFDGQYIDMTYSFTITLTDESLKTTQYFFNVKVVNREPYFGNVMLSFPEVVAGYNDQYSTALDLNQAYAPSDQDLPFQTLQFTLKSTQYQSFIYIDQTGIAVIMPLGDLTITGKYQVDFDVSDGIAHITGSFIAYIEKPPYFKVSSLSNIIMTCCEKESLILPEAYDDESSQKPSISFDIGEPFLITQSPTQWLIDTSQIPFEKVITVFLTDINNYKGIYSFSIIINHRPIIINSPVDQLIIAGQSKQYNMTGLGTDLDVGDTVRIVLRYQGQSVLPSFMIFDQDLLTMAPSASMQASSFEIEMKVADLHNAESIESKTFKVTVTGILSPVKVNTGPPFFDGLDTFPDISLKLHDSYTVIFPAVQDPDGDQYTLAIQDFAKLGLYLFCTLTKSSMIIKPFDSSHAGTYPIVIQLKDNNKYMPMSQSFNFILEITDPEFDNANVNDQEIANVEEGRTSTQYANNADSDYQIKTINDNDEELFFKNDKTKKSTKSVYLPRRIIKDRLKQNLDLKARVESINSYGEISVIFNRDVKIPTYYSSFNQSMIELTLITKNLKLGGRILKAEMSSTEQDQKIINFTWTISEFTSRKFTIEIQFIQPLEVSNEETHFLSAKFVQNGYFIDKVTGKSISLNYTMISKVPKQIIKDDMSLFLGKNAQIIKTTLSTIMQTNFLANIALSSSLQFIWGLINALQLIVRVPLIAVKFPANAQILFGIMIDITNFSFFSIKSIEELFFQFTPTNPLNDNFDALGYNSRNSVQNAGIMFYYLILIIMTYALILFFRGVFRVFKVDEKSESMLWKIYSWVKLISVYSLILRFLLEGYIELAIGALLQIKGFENENSSDGFASVYAILMSIICLIMPFFTFFLLRKNYQTLKQSTTYQSSFNTLLVNLRWKEKPQSLLYTPLFLFRRLLFAISALFLLEYPLFQVHLLFFQTIFVVAFLIKVKPFNDPTLTYLEIFNEICIYLVTLPLLLFTDVVSNLETIYLLGWMIVFIVIINIFVNITIMIIINLKGARIMFKKWRLQRSKKKTKKSDQLQIIVVKPRVHILKNVQKKSKPYDQQITNDVQNVISNTNAVNNYQKNVNVSVKDNLLQINNSQIYEIPKEHDFNHNNQSQEIKQDKSQQQNQIQSKAQSIMAQFIKQRLQNKNIQPPKDEEKQNIQDISQVRRKRKQIFDEV